MRLSIGSKMPAKVIPALASCRLGMQRQVIGKEERR